MAVVRFDTLSVQTTTDRPLAELALSDSSWSVPMAELTWNSAPSDRASRGSKASRSIRRPRAWRGRATHDALFMGNSESGGSSGRHARDPPSTDGKEADPGRHGREWCQSESVTDVGMSGPEPG